MENLKKQLQQIWSREYWNAEAGRIELAYWSEIKGKIPDVPSPATMEDTEHRIEAFVRKLSRVHGLGNLHVGLTSSDLEDNIRIKRLEECANIVNDAIYFVLRKLENFPDCQLIAYTHLKPAGVTTFQNRMAPTVDAIRSNVLGSITYRGIGGSIGTNHMQKLMGVDARVLDDEIFPGDTQQHKHQTGDHVADFVVAQWLTLHAALLAKICNDFRLMFAFGQAVPKQDGIGSTAIAAKAPNPWRFEKASGLAGLLFVLPGQVATILSECLLERTLTNQAALNRLFENAFLLFVEMLGALSDGLERTEIVDQSEECKKPVYHSEEEVLELVWGGLPREEAHKQIHQKYNNNNK